MALKNDGIRILPASLLFFVLATVIYAGYVTGQRYLTTDRHQPPLEVAEEFLDFGVVNAKEDFPWRLVVKNTSTHTVNVADIKNSCNCTDITPRSFSIAAGETRDLMLTIDLSFPRSSRLDTFTHDAIFRIAPVLEASTVSQPYWELRGRIEVPCILENTTVVFAGMHEIAQGRNAPTRVIRGKLKDKTFAIHATVPERVGVVTVSHQSEELIISVTPNSNREVGWFEFPVVLTTRNPAGAVVGRQEISVYGEVVPPFAFSPKSMSLGIYEANSWINEHVSVNCSEGEIVDASALSKDVQVQVEPRTKSHALVGVRIQVKDLGPQHRQIHLIYRSASGELSTATIPICFFGTPRTETSDPNP